MPQHARIRKERLTPREGMQVRAAYADPANPHQRVHIGRHGARRRALGELTWLVEDDFLHCWEHKGL
jgi:hypothetical protein